MRPGRVRVRSAPATGLLRRAACLVVVAVVAGGLVAACAASRPSPPLAGPVRLFGSGPTLDYAGDYPPGTPFAWAVTVRNGGPDPAVIDGYELVGRSPGLRVDGAVVLPMDWRETGLVLGPVMTAIDELRAAGGQELSGATLAPTSSEPWTEGAALVFFLAAPDGDSAVEAVRLRYHVGDASFQAELPARLDVCARDDLSCRLPQQVPPASPGG